jgi:hypothetical protein
VRYRHSLVLYYHKNSLSTTVLFFSPRATRVSLWAAVAAIQSRQGRRRVFFCFPNFFDFLVMKEEKSETSRSKEVDDGLNRFVQKNIQKRQKIVLEAKSEKER